MFYLIAPFLVTKKVKWQIILVLTGISAKCYFDYFHYLCFDPWTYRFFPFELAFFMAGSVAYAFYKQLQFKSVSPKIGYTLLSICIFGVFILDEIKVQDDYKNTMFYLFLLGSIPFIFNALKDNVWDRKIGELSFSLYISHHLLVSLWRGYFFKNPDLMSYYGITVILCSLLVAIILQMTIIKGIENYRTKRFS